MDSSDSVARSHLRPTEYRRLRSDTAGETNTAHSTGTADAFCDHCLTLVMLTTFKDFSRSVISQVSLQLHMPPAVVKELLLVVPHSEFIVLRSFYASFKNSPWAVRVVPEYQALRTTKAKLQGTRGLYGYKLQMLLKLYSALEVRSPFYLLLDSDVLMVNSVRNSSWLFPAPGKAVYQPQQRRTHAEWWKDSEEMLGLTGCLSRDMDARLFGVTPAILSTNISLMTVKYIEKRFESRVLVNLATHQSSKWTEYCSYRIIACHYNLFEQFHAIKPTKAPSLYTGYWRSDGLAGKLVTKCPNCILQVVQSNTFMPVHEVVSALEQVFRRTSPSTINSRQ